MLFKDFVKVANDFDSNVNAKTNLFKIESPEQAKQVACSIAMFRKNGQMF